MNFDMLVSNVPVPVYEVVNLCGYARFTVVTISTACVNSVKYNY